MNKALITIFPTAALTLPVSAGAQSQAAYNRASDNAKLLRCPGDRIAGDRLAAAA